MNKVKTSIIIPVYNTEQYIDECIQSAINQTQSELEIIAVDDGSTDNSTSILNRYSQDYENISLIIQKNMKLGAARNSGIKHAEGQYVYFLDSDDFLEANAMEICYSYAEKYSLDVVLFDAHSFIEGELAEGFHADSFDRRDVIKEREWVYSGREFLNQYMYTSPDTVSACLMYTSKAFIDKNNLSFLAETFYEDEEYRFKLMLAAKRVMYIPFLLYNRRYRPGSIMSTENSLLKLTYRIGIIKKMVEDVGIYGKQKDILEKKYIELRFGGLLNACRDITDNKEKTILAEKINKLLEYTWDYLCMSEEDADDILIYYRQYKNLLCVFGNIDFIEKQYDLFCQQGKNILKSILEKLPLREENAVVGIYGTGLYTNQLLNNYCTLVGGIKAKIVYIDSNKKSDSSVYNYSSIYNVNDIEEMGIDAIIISSIKYEQEIFNKIHALYGDKFQIYRLYADSRRLFF